MGYTNIYKPMSKPILNLPCARLQIPGNESIIRKDELDGLVTIKTNLRELDAAMNGVLQRIGNTEESIKTVKFQLRIEAK